MNRREALTRLAAVVGGIGAAFAAIPLIRYFVPSERAKALVAPASVDVSKLQPGHTTSVMWRGKPIMIFRRTPEQLEGIRLSDSHALDESPPAEDVPASANNEYRSIDPEFLVVVSSCTHLGCIPRQDTTIGKDLLGDWWPGGFHCPCHDSMYDNAGRVVRGPAPLNLRIPPYYFSSENEIVFGSESS